MEGCIVKGQRVSWQEGDERLDGKKSLTTSSALSSSYSYPRSEALMEPFLARSGSSEETNEFPEATANPLLREVSMGFLTLSKLREKCSKTGSVCGGGKQGEEERKWKKSALVVLDQGLGSESRVDAGSLDVLVVVVEGVEGTESDRRKSRVDVVEVVVVVGLGARMTASVSERYFLEGKRRKRRTTRRCPESSALLLSE